MFIDTHCHLTDNYNTNIDNLLTNANNANVGILVCATADPNDINKAITLAEQHNNIFVTTGIHPDYINSDISSVLTQNILTHDKVIGIGEIGLDYHYNKTTRSAQIELFEKQLYLAQQYNMPVAIHTRDAEEDTLSILTSSNKGVLHCFTSSWNMASTLLDRGFYFSASGILTFKNADDIRDTFRKIPLDRIVIETDSPFCAPIPYRGQQCEPAMVIETAKVLSQIKQLQLSDLEIILENNTKRLYPKCHVNL